MEEDFSNWHKNNITVHIVSLKEKSTSPVFLLELQELDRIMKTYRKPLLIMIHVGTNIISN